MRKFDFKNLDEVTISAVNGKPCYRYLYERGLFEKTDKTLLNNFNKVAVWIKENCPNLNGEFSFGNNPYYWIRLTIENGKAYLETGSHGYGYDIALSVTETATFSRGSNQSTPHAYSAQFFRNDRLEEFLRQWKSIKARIIKENAEQSYVFSSSFEP